MLNCLLKRRVDHIRHDTIPSFSCVLCYIQRETTPRYFADIPMALLCTMHISRCFFSNHIAILNIEFANRLCIFIIKPFQISKYIMTSNMVYYSSSWQYFSYIKEENKFTNIFYKQIQFGTLGETRGIVAKTIYVKYSLSDLQGFK